MTTRLKIQVVFQIGQTLYVVLINRITGQVWNNNSHAFENYNSANWAHYAIALTELTGSGIYQAAYPSQIAATEITNEVFYQQAGGGPVVGDVPAAGLNPTQGQNVVGLAGDPVAAQNQEAAASVMTVGQAAGTPTTSVIATDLSSTQAGAYAGRSVLFTSGPAALCAGRIVGYAADGTITLAAPLAVAPSAGDNFVIV